MNRIAGLEKNQAPWHLRWFYSTMRKMFGKDLTPVKQQMRVPGLVWGGIAMEAGLGSAPQSRLRRRQRQLIPATKRLATKKHKDMNRTILRTLCLFVAETFVAFCG